MLENVQIVLSLEASLDVGGRLFAGTTPKYRRVVPANRQLTVYNGGLLGLFFRDAFFALFLICFPLTLLGLSIVLAILGAATLLIDNRSPGSSDSTSLMNLAVSSRM